MQQRTKKKIHNIIWIHGNLEQSPSWGADNHLASQEIACLFIMFIMACLWILLWASWIQSISPQGRILLEKPLSLECSQNYPGLYRTLRPTIGPYSKTNESSICPPRIAQNYTQKERSTQHRRYKYPLSHEQRTLCFQGQGTGDSVRGYLMILNRLFSIKRYESTIMYGKWKRKQFQDTTQVLPGMSENPWKLQSR